MINQKNVDRKFDRGLVGYIPVPKPPLYLKLEKKKSCGHKNSERQKELKFQCDCHCFLKGPLQCNRNLKKKKFFWMEFLGISGNFLRFAFAIDRQSFLVSSDG